MSEYIFQEYPKHLSQTVDGKTVLLVYPPDHPCAGRYVIAYSRDGEKLLKGVGVVAEVKMTATGEHTHEVVVKGDNFSAQHPAGML
jgi:hypothetical protein